MRLREGRIAHTGRQIDLMLVAQVGQVDRQAAAAPDKLQVSASLGLVEGLEDSPEPANDCVFLVIVLPFSDRLETFEVDRLLAGASPLKGLPVQEVEDLCPVLHDLQEAFTDHLDLFFSFLHASLKYLLDEFTNVCLGYLDVFAVRAERHFITARKHSCEILVHTVLEVLITQVLGVLLHITENLCRISIDSIQVLQSKLLP